MCRDDHFVRRRKQRAREPSVDDRTHAQSRFELRMPPDGVIINRDVAIGRDEFAGFGQRQRIDFQRTRFHAARRGENFRIDSVSCFAFFGESPHDATASSTAESNGPPFTSHGILRAAAARSSIPEPPPAEKMIIGARAASSIANERENSRSISIFSSTSIASTGNCPIFIANIRSACARTTSGFLAKATPPIPARL